MKALTCVGWHSLLLLYCIVNPNTLFMPFRPAILLLFGLGLCCALWGRSAEGGVLIDEISISGNKRTKAAVIRREMLIQEGDTIPLDELSARISRCEEVIMNTGLFNRAKITYKEWEGSTNRVHLLVTVEEGWYIFPVPIFELADRNFNVWWVDQGRALDRTNYGLHFAHINVSGHRDKLKSTIKYGYTRKYSLFYERPYLNRSKTLGAWVDAGYWANREVNYATREGKQVFFRKEDGFLYRHFSGSLGLAYRPDIFGTHRLELEYRDTRVGAEVTEELNPDYLLEGRSRLRSFRLAYQYVYENRDAAAYPWSGNFAFAAAVKDGLGVFGQRSGLTVYGGYGHYFPMGQRWSFGAEARAKYSVIRSPQPYRENRALGFGNYTLHGWEYYIVDGLDLGLLKTALRFRFWSFDFNFGKLMPMQALRSMPVRLQLALNNDLAFVNSPHNRADNPFSNRLLWGGGLGLEAVFYYDKVVRIEYSLNDLLEKGLFLHFSMNI